jgi:hypothetical protein
VSSQCHSCDQWGLRPEQSDCSCDNLPGTGLHCVADIDMYSEFVITMTIPAIGLLFIFLFYHGWLWRIQRLTAAASDSLDAETGALQKQGDSLEDTDALASHGARDLCAWLAIGWLFMVKQAPNQSTRTNKCSLLPLPTLIACSCRSTPSSAGRPSNPLPALTSMTARHFTKTSEPAKTSPIIVWSASKLTSE